MKNPAGGCVHHFLHHHHHSIAARIGEDRSAEAQDGLGSWGENDVAVAVEQVLRSLRTDTGYAVLVQAAETDRKPLHGEQGKEKMGHAGATNGALTRKRTSDSVRGVGN